MVKLRQGDPICRIVFDKLADIGNDGNSLLETAKQGSAASKRNPESESHQRPHVKRRVAFEIAEESPDALDGAQASTGSKIRKLWLWLSLISIHQARC